MKKSLILSVMLVVCSQIDAMQTNEMINKFSKIMSDAYQCLQDIKDAAGNGANPQTIIDLANEGMDEFDRYAHPAESYLKDLEKLKANNPEKAKFFQDIADKRSNPDAYLGNGLYRSPSKDNILAYIEDEGNKLFESQVEAQEFYNREIDKITKHLENLNQMASRLRADFSANQEGEIANAVKNLQTLAAGLNKDSATYKILNLIETAKKDHNSIYKNIAKIKDVIIQEREEDQFALDRILLPVEELLREPIQSGDILNHLQNLTGVYEFKEPCGSQSTDIVFLNNKFSTRLVNVAKALITKEIKTKEEEVEAGKSFMSAALCCRTDLPKGGILESPLAALRAAERNIGATFDQIKGLSLREQIVSLSILFSTIVHKNSGTSFLGWKNGENREAWVRLKEITLRLILLLVHE